MPGELKELLDAFSTFGTRYSDNAQEVISDPDGKRLAAVYGAGMTGAMSGLRETLGGVYDELPDPRRGDLDRLVAMSGALEMLAKANELVGPGSMETAEGLVTAQDVVKKIKAILRQILGELKLTPGSATPGTEEGKAAGLIELILKAIDLFLDNFLKVMPPRPPTPQPQPQPPGPAPPGPLPPGFGGPKLPGRPPAEEMVVLPVCEFVTLFDELDTMTGIIDVRHVPTVGGEGAGIEVEVDGKVVKTLKPGETIEATGKRIRAHAVGRDAVVAVPFGVRPQRM